MASMGAYAHTPLSEPRAPPSTLTRIAALLTVRSHARLQSSYPLADAILALLEASGVAVDDKRRAWHLQSAQPVTRPPPLPSDAPRCAFCSAAFPSRNALFKHLRDPRSRCSRLTEERDGANPPARADDGGGISLAKGEGEKVVNPPRGDGGGGNLLARGEGGREVISQRGECERVPGAGDDALGRGKGGEELRLQKRRTRDQKAHPPVERERCLWFGELPRAWANSRCLLSLLWHRGPPGVPQPWIKVMARRPRRGRPYAIVAFRDAEEAERVRAAMDGVWVGGESCASSQLVEGGGGGGGGFELKVRACEHGDRQERSHRGEMSAGCDPPLLCQLRPLPRPALLERLHRLGHRGGEEGKVQREEAGLGVREASTSELRARLALALSMPDARRVVRLSGHAIPPTLAKELLTTLSRSGYQSEL